jgi:hypothetical protein
MHERLAAFEAAGRTEGVLFIGRPQEKNTVFRTGKRRAADGSSYPWIVRATSVVNQFCVHCVDEDFGAFFRKFSSYFPTARSCWSTGITTPRPRRPGPGSGSPRWTTGSPRWTMCPRFRRSAIRWMRAKIGALARKWLAILPDPCSAAGQAAGYRYDISVLQAEFSLTQVLDKPLSGRVFFGQVIHDNLAIGRPDQAGLIFDRKIARQGPRASPVTTGTGTRVAGLRLTDPRAVLRRHLAPLLGTDPDLMTSGQITYDLRRLRLHGLIERIPHTFCCQVTDTGMRTAQFLTRVHDRVLCAGLAQITDPDPPDTSPITSTATASNAPPRITCSCSTRRSPRSRRSSGAS